ncbi:MAG: prenyltransferase [Myxococcales bacterium]|nr:prenyltransferase [Myxococcales bacterium]MDH5305632.1 prenyltransferase [Myxococcales bacterium]MDH5565137.1 prenyltransferase [Myxococcales bacterium]
MAGSLHNWGEIFRTQNLSSERAMDAVSRWLLITRASVIPVTLFSGAIGVLLAARSEDPHWFYAILALLGLVAAHAASNMINDYFDLESGVDRDEYARMRYAPHPVLSGLISKKGLLLAIAGVLLLALGMLLFLTEARAWPVAAFALTGLFVVVFYAAPPLKLERRGLGEPGVLLVWGPLMTGGTYYVTTGVLPPWVLVASLPYALLVTVVVMGSHIDKFDADSAIHVRTLPVLLGRERALFLTQEVMVGFFVLLLCLVLVGTFGVWTLLSFLAMPSLLRALRIYNRPRPESAPPDSPEWPLWYVVWAFRLARNAGGLLVIGLLLDAIYPLRLE